MLSSCPRLPHVQSVLKGIQIPESRKFMLVGSGILDLGIWNMAQGIQNPTNDWNPESKFHWQKRESSKWNLESSPWNTESKTVSLGFPLYMGNTEAPHTYRKYFFQFYEEKWICGTCICLLTKLHWMTTTLFNRVNAHKKGCRSCTSNSFPGHSKCTALHFSGDLKLNSAFSLFLWKGIQSSFKPNLRTQPLFFDACQDSI